MTARARQSHLSARRGPFLSHTTVGPSRPAGGRQSTNHDPFFQTARRPSAAGHRADHAKRLLSRRNRRGQRVVDGLARQVLPAGEEADEVAALGRLVVPDRALEDGVALLERVEDGARRRRRLTSRRTSPSTRASVRRWWGSVTRITAAAAPRRRARREGRARSASSCHPRRRTRTPGRRWCRSRSRTGRGCRRPSRPEGCSHSSGSAAVRFVSASHSLPPVRLR